MRPITILVWPVTLLAWAWLSGCAAERTLTITSEPPGAEVWIDNNPVGTTPVQVEFIHYGTRRVTLYMDGYMTWSEPVPIRPPWYARFPIDLVSEVLIPVGWEDDHPLHVTLTAGEEVLSLPTLRSVFDRAEALRRAVTGPRDLPPIVLAEPHDTGVDPEGGAEAEPEGGSDPPR
ncbi:MAG: PEGA domain-containing protein [Planctomycetota bacterium]|nr:PEGA domain-containing protein [Planctomycetota bacterium]